MDARLAERLRRAMSGATEKMAVVGVAPVAGPSERHATPQAHVAGRFGYASKPLQLQALRPLRVKIHEKGNHVLEGARPVAKGVVGPVAEGVADQSGPADADWQAEIDERAAIAIELGEVPEVYADAYAKLQAERPDGVAVCRWQQAIDDAGRFLDRWGRQAARLGWTANDLFDWVPSGCCGLAWEMRGRRVTALTATGAALDGDASTIRGWFAR